MLRIFSDKSFLPPGKPHFVIFYPFWGKCAENPEDPDSGRYDHYLTRGAEFFEISDLESADIAVLPATWENYRETQAKEVAERFVEIARRAQKNTVVFFWSDSTETVALNGITTFRTSLFASRKSAQEFAMPAWSEDFLQHYLEGRLSLRKKANFPVVGFCGAAPAPQKKTIKEKIGALLNQREEDARFIRKRAIDFLEASKNVQTNFIIRESFLGGALLPDGRLDYKRARESRLEFVRNMIDSDYVLCVRGAGNFSYRLYETLSCGRIPVFVNTDCVLPYQNLIDWRKYCVWVEQNDLSEITARVTQFHNRLTDEEFQKLQEDCRKLWEDYLSPEGFFANFHRHFLQPLRHRA